MRCKRCGHEAVFYKSITTMCRDCWKVRVRANRLANIEHYREYDRIRGRDPDRAAHYAVKQRRKRSEMGPAYTRAHNMVRRAIAAGKLVRPKACQRCSIGCKPHAHHDDHAKPLDVMWLCPVCHAARHVELNAKRAALFVRV